MRYFRVTISDNDFWFLMEQTLNYVCNCLPSYFLQVYKGSGLSGEEIIKETIKEYLDMMHIKDDIKSYIFEHLKISTVDTLSYDNENSEVYYIYNDGQNGYEWTKR